MPVLLPFFIIPSPLPTSTAQPTSIPPEHKLYTDPQPHPNLVSGMATNDPPSEDPNTTGDKYPVSNPRNYPQGALEYLRQPARFRYPKTELRRRFNCYAEAFRRNHTEPAYDWREILDHFISDYIVHNGALVSKASFLDQLWKERHASYPEILVDDFYNDASEETQSVSACVSIKTWSNREYHLAHINDSPEYLRFEHGFYYFKDGKLSTVYNVVNTIELEDRHKRAMDLYDRQDWNCFPAVYAKSTNDSKGDEIEDHVIVTADEVDLPAETETAEKSNA